MHPKISNKLDKAAVSQLQMISEIMDSNLKLILFKPDEQSWSILEVAEHCHNIESAIINNLIKYKDYPSQSAGIKAFINFILLKVAMKGGLRFKAPPIKGLSPEGKHSPEEITSNWKRIREKLIQYLEVFPDEKLNHTVFKHPRAGFITISQTVDFINDHTLHHLKQIDRIKQNYFKYQKS